MKYNYVIFSHRNSDYNRIAWNDVSLFPNMRYIDTYPYRGGKVLQLLRSFHFSKKVNSLIDLPFKSLWNQCYFYNDFREDYPICFVFTGRVAFLIKYGLIKTLKKMYPRSKYVCYYQDLISTHLDVSIQQVKETFDIVISYDKEDAKLYDILYFPTIYSKVDEIPVGVGIKECDAYFLGAAKNRLQDIYSVYSLLTEKGLKCEFYITNVPKEHRRKESNIHYISHMSYMENLQHVIKSKAIVEVLQKDAVGVSFRAWEAAVYDKELIKYKEGKLERCIPEDISVSTVLDFVNCIENLV